MRNQVMHAMKKTVGQETWCVFKIDSGVLKNFSSKHAKTKNLFIEYAVDS